MVNTSKLWSGPEPSSLVIGVHKGIDRIIRAAVLSYLLTVTTNAARERWSILSFISIPPFAGFAGFHVDLQLV